MLVGTWRRGGGGGVGAGNGELPLPLGSHGEESGVGYHWNSGDGAGLRSGGTGVIFLGGIGRAATPDATKAATKARTVARVLIFI